MSDDYHIFSLMEGTPLYRHSLCTYSSAGLSPWTVLELDNICSKSSILYTIAKYVQNQQVLAIATLYNIINSGISIYV